MRTRRPTLVQAALAGVPPTTAILAVAIRGTMFVLHVVAIHALCTIVIFIVGHWSTLVVPVPVLVPDIEIGGSIGHVADLGHE